ncbi:hypothetical protein, partial [Pseudomonas sp. SID14000]|uniref:hypothetical protein n=1 Tax=Pseudomonas sp. SID14000 TaxID=1986221 RepID=UPI00111E46E2
MTTAALPLPDLLARIETAPVSPTAFNVWIYLHSGQWLRCETLERESRLSSHQVRQGARELRAAGLIERARVYER